MTAGRIAGVSGIVLAGGRSARFGPPGGPSKLDADLAGRSVLDRTIDALEAVCDEVLVVGRVEGARSGVRYLADASPFEGPLIAVAAGLAAAAGDVAAVVGGDMPLLDAALLRLLIGRLVATPDAGATLLDDGASPRPLPVVLRRDLAVAAADRAIDAGSRSLQSIVSGLRTIALAPVDWRAIDPDAGWALDIDRPEDLEVALHRVAPDRS